ncbi:glycosyltransferase, partial [Sodalis sp.]|uniref:glycosyltransferase n=1 Tax=Sodalis sp. (in: enterobacteria) TaxID=1898979 RepID=UPI003873A79C
EGNMVWQKCSGIRRSYLASRSEGLPRVVLEAMLLGTPVIGSALTGTAELVRHQDTGLLFPYGDVAQLAHHLATLYSDADQRRLLARRANERLRRQFTIENYVAGVEAVLAGGHSS